MSNTYYIHYKTGSKYIAMFPCELCEQRDKSNPSCHNLENEEDDSRQVNVCSGCYVEMAQSFELVECPFFRCQKCDKGMFPPPTFVWDNSGEENLDG